MTVIGSGREDVRQIKEVSGDEWLVDRPTQRDLRVPFSAIRTVDGERAMLTCPTGEANNQGWRASDLMACGSGGASSRTRCRR